MKPTVICEYPFCTEEVSDGPVCEKHENFVWVIEKMKPTPRWLETLIFAVGFFILSFCLFEFAFWWTGIFWK